MIKYLVALRDWVDARFPLLQLWNDHLARYYAPKNFNFWYFFGSLALFVLLIQIVTGIWLTMNYKPSAENAFASVEYIMRDVEWGWWIRYMHSTGASAFFIVIYLHMYRAMLYGSYKRPRELLWIIGMLIYFTLMAEAFFGYLLPWGQMSYWGAQVIISLFGALPLVGDELALWIRGDFVVSDVTLNRFFSLHVIAFPLVLCGLVGAHLIALHEVGSNNPDGIEIKDHKDADGVPLDGIPFHPYYTVKDIVGVVVFLIIFCAVVFFTSPRWAAIFSKPTTSSPPTRSRRRNTSRRCGTSRRSTPSCGPCRASSAAWSPWARQRCCSFSCPGWTAARSNQYATGAGSTRPPWACSPSASWRWAGWACNPLPTPIPGWRVFSH